MGVKCSAAHQSRFHLELQIEDIQNFNGLCNDFGANAVAWQNCNFHGIFYLKGGLKWCGPTTAWWPVAPLQKL